MSVRPGTLLGRFACLFFFFEVAELELWDATLPRGGDAGPDRKLSQREKTKPFPQPHLEPWIQPYQKQLSMDSGPISP